ncbi:cytochrome C assembly family protein [Marinicellulosiphila megalodicopiae]|uniref:cytochrome C assembly family protein n=1 Tax=Marinicellulosiphila megalodicopiae TaxID=2724896 RepID=UPI003BB078AA
MIILSASLTSMAYLLVSLLQGLSIFSKGKKPNKNLIIAIALIAIMAHIHILSSQIWTENGVILSLYNILSLISICFVNIILLSSFRKPVDNLFVFLFPFAALSVLLSSIWGTDAAAKHFELGLISHIFLSIIAYSILMISAVQAILLWLQNHQLKHNLNGRLTQVLPSLQSMERLLFDLILIGFVLLTLSIFTGIVFKGFAELSSPEIFQKLIFTIVAWLIYLALLVGHLMLGWRGVIASKLTIAGFVFLVIAFLGTKLLFIN